MHLSNDESSFDKMSSVAREDGWDEADLITPTSINSNDSVSKVQSNNFKFYHNT